MERLKGKKVLLVEDNLENQILIIEILKDFEIKVDLANNGDEAIAKFNSNNYSLILMDIQMPIKNGIEATKEIREIDKSIPIVALTANNMPDEIKLMREVKIDEIINKPIIFEKFKSILLKYISLNKTQTPNELKLEGFKALDTKKALTNLQNNYNLYIKLLKEFYKSYKNFKIDDEDFKIQIHTLKSLSGSIGAEKLYKLTKDIEQTKDKNYLPLVYEELDKILLEIKTLIL